MKKLHVLGSRVLLKQVKSQQVVNGIALPDNVQNGNQKFTVIDIGPDVLDVEIGDNVIIDQYTGIQVKQDDVICRIVEEDEILARLN